VRRSVKPPVELKKKVFSKTQRKLPNFAHGLAAEDLAIHFLLLKNYRLLDRNLRLGNFEIDLIMLDLTFDEIVFVEVKYRRTMQAGEGSVSVDARKINHMNQVARAFLRKHDYQKAHRFDIISIVGNLQSPEILHFENITWL
jgi:putative endonuclease